MMKKLAIPLFIVALGASSTVLLAAPSQSLHFNVAAPAAAGTSGDDLRIGIKASGVPNINSGAVDLLPGDPAETVAIKAGKEACIASFTKPGAGCVFNLGAFPAGCVGVACCGGFDTAAGGPPGVGQNYSCTAGGIGFVLNHTVGQSSLSIGAVGGGSITHLTADNRGIYTDLGVDIAPKSLIQIRPNGLTGTIQIKVFHSQAGANPRIANVLIDGSNNDPSEAAALHSAIKAALENISPPLSPAISVTVHPLNDATYPLTAFGFLKQATSFAEISNINAVGISEVGIVTLPGMGQTAEGTENVSDPTTANVPTLSGWGALIATTVLLLMILWMHRRKMRQQEA